MLRRLRLSFLSAFGWLSVNSVQLDEGIEREHRLPEQRPRVQALGQANIEGEEFADANVA